MLQKSFDDCFEFFARVHHRVVIVDVDVSKQSIFVVHQRTEHYDVLNRLIVSIASTEDRLHIKNLATMKKVRKIDFLNANLSRK
jgi:hypothetical protein